MEPKPPIYDLSYRDAFWAVRAYEDRCDRIALRALLPGSGSHLVDLGAGFGRLVDEYGAFASISLVDASPVMVEAACERVAADPRCTVILGTSTDLPMADESVDVVVSVRLLVHLHDPAATFHEVARTLRTGGTLIVEFPNRRHLLARLRYRFRRQAWSPMDRQPHEYVPGHFSHHPKSIERQLRHAGLEPTTWRSVSLFRAAWLTSRVPAAVLAGIERPLQGLLGRLGPGPSTYVRAIKSGPSGSPEGSA
ncbi:MAG: methyltransferase domain-containing protein [Chloroflexota bacterium]